MNRMNLPVPFVDPDTYAGSVNVVPSEVLLNSLKTKMDNTLPPETTSNLASAYMTSSEEHMDLSSGSESELSSDDMPRAGRRRGCKHPFSRLAAKRLKPTKSTHLGDLSVKRLSGSGKRTAIPFNQLFEPPTPSVALKINVNTDSFEILQQKHKQLEKEESQDPTISIGFGILTLQPKSPPVTLNPVSPSSPQPCKDPDALFPLRKSESSQP
ncbi:unnamed protein product [Protopolystoma xenopodis]|uniref:Uncharacterized protein n=1 Tax=Protopolystoma xenopodis TaxID=117903 RepID=A0A448WTB7_9PLAT|nr:unnamed protein product [Protopolystoma xenopodis]